MTEISIRKTDEEHINNSYQILQKTCARALSEAYNKKIMLV